MLEIYIKGQDQPLMVSERLESVLHDVRVIQGIPFLDVGEHDLVNLTEVWRMLEVETVLPDPPYQVVDSSGGMLHYPLGGDSRVGAHQGPRDGCPICKVVDDVRAQQMPDADAGPDQMGDLWAYRDQHGHPEPADTDEL